MPAKYSIKKFIPDSYYHIFNRGVEKRNIFSDDHDYATFIYNINRYMNPSFRITRMDPRNGDIIYVSPDPLYEKVTLVAFCLMPNHFHLLLKLKEPQGITQLVKNICNNYTSYFNIKYERVGKLYQGVYKAVPVSSGEQFLQLSRYIHLNPVELEIDITKYKFSSFYYIYRNQNVPWLNWKELLLGQSDKNYIDFVLSKAAKGLTSQELDYIKPIAIG